MTKLSEIMTSNFHDFWKVVRESAYTFYVAKGGRNSAKSTALSLAFIMLLVMYPINGLAIRKVGKTMQESVFEQLKEATMFLGIEEEFIFRVNPLKITYIPRGNYIIFRGADDPMKIKSIKTANFPIALVWIEELAEFKTEEDLQIIIDSILRAELPDKIKYRFFYSYNPPKRKSHWLNKKYETQFIAKNTYVHHSTYLDNNFLAEETLEEIEQVKEHNKNKYDWYYKGVPLGGGIVPFNNLQFRAIKDKEIESFDNIRQGIDWGYSVDPLCFLRIHYDKKKETIYLFDEVYGIKIKNAEIAKKIIKKGYNDQRIICDVDPLNRDEVADFGVRIKQAKKGAGSKEYGEEWLDGLKAIVIDPARCPNAASEFESIDYQVDKDGNVLPKLEDSRDHSIDTVRYAMEDDMRRKAVEFLK